MSTSIQTNPIEGFKIYGMQMVNYTVNGSSGKDFDAAVSFAAFNNATTIEKETSAYSSVLKARQKKLQDLGEGLAQLSYIAGLLPTDEPESDDRVKGNFWGLKNLLAQYGIDLYIQHEEASHFLWWEIEEAYDYVTRRTVENTKTNTQYEIDKEDNDMQQDVVTLQGLVSKRDQSFATAAKVVRKFNATGDTIIRSIGQ